MRKINMNKIKELELKIEKFKKIITVPRLHTEYLKYLEKQQVENTDNESKIDSLYYLSNKPLSSQMRLTLTSGVKSPSKMSVNTDKHKKSRTS
jgi:hypothetical protein